MKPTNCFVWLLLAAVFIRCNQFADKNKLQAPEFDDTTSYRAKDTIPAIRNPINLKPVSSFSELVTDEFNKWEFVVKIDEIFKYLIKIRYKELDISETLTVPNFDTVPKVIIKKDTIEHSCIIGFADKKGKFKKYEIAVIKNDQLKLIGLKSYFVIIYKIKSKYNLHKNVFSN